MGGPRSNIKVALCVILRLLQLSSSLQPPVVPLVNPITASSKQIWQLTEKSALRQRGSKSYQKAWRHWLHLSIDAIRHELSQSLPHPVDEDKLEDLSFSLGVAADVGEMPSFEDAGARSGYALDYFCRARLLADLFIITDTYSSDHMGEECHLTSIGGGPGFDHVAAALASIFNAAGNSERIVPVNTTVLDYESGWKDLVDAMNDATNNALPTRGKIHSAWGGICDITKSIHHETNTNCLKVVKSTTLWTCQYCVAENAFKLRDSNYIFFRELFSAASYGATFWITETTPRMWPKFYEMVLQYNNQSDHSMLSIGFPYMRGQQMLIKKSSKLGESIISEVISERDYGLLRNFEKYSQCHDELMNSGWERQRKKRIVSLR